MLERSRPGLFSGLQFRQKSAERMDQPELPAAEHRWALRSLARINWFSRSAKIVGPAIFQAARERKEPSPLKVLDLASGGGDVLTALAGRARRQKLDIEWIGCDFSPVAVEHSREQALRAKLAVEFRQADALVDPLPECDIAMCSLFLHHLEDDQAVTLLTRMREAAGQMVLVNDLRRTRLGYLLAEVACQILTRSPVVHYDGPVSVAGAYTIEEVRRLAETAGLKDAKFTKQWPQRFLMHWRRP